MKDYRVFRLSILTLVCMLAACRYVLYNPFMKNSYAPSDTSIPGTYEYRRLLTIDYTKVSGTTALISFPLLIDITDTYLRNVANGGQVESANGYDICFTAQDGVTALAHQLESYDPVNGSLTAWVSIPSLSYTANTCLYMYYGKNTAVSSENINGVWGASYRGVWHLTNGGLDSAGGCNGTEYSTTPVAGQIADGRSFDGATGYIEMGDVVNLSTGSMTVTMWIKRSSSGSIATLLAKSNGGSPSPDYGYLWGFNSSDCLLIYAATASASWGQDGTFVMGTSTAISDTGSWHHVAVVFDRSNAANCEIFIDGVACGDPPAGNVANLGDVTNIIPLRIGGESDGECKFAGSLDEVIISDTARSSGWIITSYNNQSDPGTFYSTGPEETGW